MKKIDEELIKHLKEKDKIFFSKIKIPNKINALSYKGNVIVFFLDEYQSNINEDVLDFLEFLFKNTNDEEKSEINYGFEKEIYFGAIDYLFGHNHVTLNTFKKVYNISKKYNSKHTLEQFNRISNLIESSSLSKITYPGTTKEKRNSKHPNNYLKYEFIKQHTRKLEAKVLSKKNNNKKIAQKKLL